MNSFSKGWIPHTLSLNKTWESRLFIDILTIFTKAACTDRAFMSFGKGNWALSSVKEIINTWWLCGSHTPLLTGKQEGRIKSQTGET